MRLRTARARLTALYAALFLAAGTALLGLTYGLVASSLPSNSSNTALPFVAQSQIRACEQKIGQKQASGPQAKQAGSLLAQCKRGFSAGASAATSGQRRRTLDTLLTVSLIGLAVLTITSGLLGWIVAGRVLAPVRAITDAARRATETNLSERLALRGPEDELKELADTFDAMLERLDAAFASQKRFVANAAHELRTPLAAMRTAIEVTLSKPSRTAEQLEEMAAKVRRALQRAQDTVEALLTLSMSEHGPAAHELVDLATAAEDALDGAAAPIAAAGLHVAESLAPAPTLGDPVLLERMIANLVDNAARHNEPGGWIEVRTERLDGQVLLRVANTGPLVPEDSIPLLLEPFSRAQQRLNASDGVGLGLSIAQAISRAHGAALQLGSRPGGGLDVSLTMPAAPSQSD